MCLRKTSMSAVIRAIVISLITSASLMAQLPSEAQQYVPGRILVKFRDEVSTEKAREFLEKRGARSAHVIEELGVHVVEVSPFVSEKALAHAFQGQAEVEFADLDRIYAPSTIPNDPAFYSQPLTT